MKQSSISPINKELKTRIKVRNNYIPVWLKIKRLLITSIDEDMGKWSLITKNLEGHPISSNKN